MKSRFKLYDNNVYLKSYKTFKSALQAIKSRWPSVYKIIDRQKKEIKIIEFKKKVKIKIEDFWINQKSAKSMELRIDFNNDRHHVLCVNKGDTRDDVVKKLHLLAKILQNDTELNDDQKILFSDQISITNNINNWTYKQ